MTHPEELTKRATRWRIHAGLAALLALAAGVRLYGIRWGLPDLLEEATPMRFAWYMGRWGIPEPVDFNPHFFNYPGLTFYVHFCAQALLYLFLKLRGVVDSGLDYHVLYVLDKTAFAVVGRVISTTFGVATVWVTWLAARRIGGVVLAFAVAFLLAFNTYHVSRSQMIEVDVPLTFFVALSFWLLLRMIERPTRSNCMLAGVAIGLATATKYTGALLLLPLLAAHYASWRAKNGSPLRNGGLWKNLMLSLAVAAAAFLVASPYVLIDASTFWEHFSNERQHMSLGHFGATGTPSWLFYGRSLGVVVLGWPATLAALAGLVFFGGIRRRPWALMLATFVVAYLLGITGWRMQADRYLMPLLPPALLFAGAAAASVVRGAFLAKRGRSLQIAAAAALVGVLVAPSVASAPDHLQWLNPDPRVQAREWIEANVPPGSFVLAEAYAPHLLGPDEIAMLPPAVSAAVKERSVDRPTYALCELFLFQVFPERSSLYYDLSLFPFVDYVITTSAVRLRHERDPDRFRAQIAFYDELDSRFQKVRTFTSGKSGRSQIMLYWNPAHDQPFAARDSVAAPPSGHLGSGDDVALQARFYLRLGANYEFFGHDQGALACYDLGLRYAMDTLGDFRKLVLGKARMLLALGRRDDAIRHLDDAVRSAPTPEMRRRFESLRRRIVENR